MSTQNMSLSELLVAAEKIAQEKFGGHFTLMRFTTGWKAFFGTPLTLLPVEGYKWLYVQPTHRTPESAIAFAVEMIPDCRTQSYEIDNMVTRSLMKAKEDEIARARIEEPWRR